MSQCYSVSTVEALSCRGVGLVEFNWVGCRYIYPPPIHRTSRITTRIVTVLIILVVLQTTPTINNTNCDQCTRTRNRQQTKYMLKTSPRHPTRPHTIGH
ncbi:hypothetical protein BO71DRAFT_74750 [Aspergillus ellipticus CBS 707.79]|uniref:Uncharacterized protein n=1 Tax=Aspergillus ellipticus CBS 707.79 TaxID=1448320 RepID=A0A319D0J7_9EURO|nr:hypothetical protein BO71DRAFT_74750 [Aspergillus ellipticus CBS 707.79]